MKIYTKSGDTGETHLYSGGRVGKDAVRVHAYGTVDELNAILGIALTQQVPPDIRQKLQRIQAELFAVGADLATPLEANPKWLVRLSPEVIARLETEIDEWQDELPPLKNFILPGGTLPSTILHQARTVCRRAERWIVALQREEKLNEALLVYLNRLSDWLFVLARIINFRKGVEEVIWTTPETEDSQ